MNSRQSSMLDEWCCEWPRCLLRLLNPAMFK